MVTPSATPSEPRTYRMRISRLTIDKLGVKLYDRASAVVAELIANSYDADANSVTVRVPLGTELASSQDEGESEQHGWEIVVEDDGHGMTPDEASEFYLKVGRDRRAHEEQGSTSRVLNRAVMGRKGIGKLAPFGICRQIEVLSAGGEETAEGFLTSHFIMNFDDIVRDDEEDVPLRTGTHDGTFREVSGTIVTLRDFLPKRVPDEETFHRQLARRFRLVPVEDFAILIEDTRHRPDDVTPLEPFTVPAVEETVIRLESRPVTLKDGTRLPVEGWVGMARQAYRNEEEAGVRIYARNKIVATARDFEQPAGFTGEFTARSYLVGEIHAEWLDENDGEDLIRTDRQGILWDSEYGQALRAFGADLVREVGRLSRKPRRENVRNLFLAKSRIEAKARERFKDATVIDAALDLAKQIGAFAAEDELQDEVYVDDLAEVILAVAPHKALIGAFQDFAIQLDLPAADNLDRLADLFGKTRIAELASYSQIAAERVRSIRELERTLDSTDAEESDLQKIIAEAPWLVKPDWTVLTENQGLKTFKRRFEKWWKIKTGDDVELAIGYERKRPDFTLVNIGGELHIVELKGPRHAFDKNDFDRLYNYVEAFEEFSKVNPGVMAEFRNGWRIDLIADSVSIGDQQKARLFGTLENEKIVVRTSWDDFLARAITAHEQFLDVHASLGNQTQDDEEDG